MIRAIIFDCFGVLYADCSVLFYEREVKDFLKIKDQIFDLDNQYNYGLIDEVDHAEALTDLTGLDYDFIRKHLRKDQVINQVLLDYSQKLRPDYKLGLLSNIGMGGMEAFFSGDQQRELFDAVVLSGDVGVIKPNPEIYKIMAERLGVSTDECVMIDDRISNIEGADVAGMKTILYTSNRQCVNDLEQLLGASYT